MLTLNEKEMFNIVVDNNIEIPDVADDPRFPPLLGDEKLQRNMLFIKIGEHISDQYHNTYVKVERYRETHKWVKIKTEDDVKFITVSYRLDTVYYKHGSYSRSIVQINNNLMKVLATFLKVADIETLDIHYTNLWGDDAAIPCWVEKDTGFLDSYLKKLNNNN